ncbi:MAG: galactosyldiacylglycerol synthase [Anaerolineales bacterium]|nr:galactosyldiacylglycerol synthase [Anaerolineales bacterium]
MGSISEIQLQYLIDQLEEEWTEDHDYAITPLLLDVFESEGADPNFVSILREALGDREQIEVVWSRERGE